MTHKTRWQWQGHQKTSQEFILGSKMAGLRKLIVLVAWSQKNFACFYKHSRLRLLKVEQATIAHCRTILDVHQHSRRRGFLVLHFWRQLPVWDGNSFVCIEYSCPFCPYIPLFFHCFECSSMVKMITLWWIVRSSASTKQIHFYSFLSCSSFKPPHHFLLLMLDKAVCVSHLGGHTLLPGWTLKFPPSHTLCRARPSLS